MSSSLMHVMSDEKRAASLLLELFKDKLRKELTEQAIAHIREEVMAAARRVVDELEPTIRAQMQTGWEQQLIVQLAIKEPTNEHRRV